MSHSTMIHRTSVMERTYQASPARVFRAWEDPDLRRAWGSPSDDVQIRNDAADFRIDGQDVQSCLVGGETVATVIARYHDIVQDKRIIYTEVISDPGGLQGMSLVSAEFLVAGQGTRLVLTL